MQAFFIEGIHEYTGYTWVYMVYIGIQGIHGYTGYTNYTWEYRVYMGIQFTLYRVYIGIHKYTG